MSHVRGTGHRGLTAAAIAAPLLGGVASPHAALTAESCLAKKLKEWGKLRNCQAKENGKALQKIGGPGEVPDEVRREAGQADRAGDGSGDRVPVRGERGRHGDGLRHGARVGTEDRRRERARQGQHIHLEHDVRGHDAERRSRRSWGR